MTFNRKVLLMALLAVVLLGSSVDAGVKVAGRHRHKPRAIEISQAQEEADVALWGIASPTGVLNKIAMTKQEYVWDVAKT